MSAARSNSCISPAQDDNTGSVFGHRGICRIEPRGFKEENDETRESQSSLVGRRRSISCRTARLAVRARGRATAGSTEICHARLSEIVVKD